MLSLKMCLLYAQILKNLSLYMLINVMFVKKEGIAIAKYQAIHFEKL